MPTVLRDGPYRFYFYSHEPNEPPHVHVDRGETTIKIWLCDCTVAGSRGFRAHEINAIVKLAKEHRAFMTEAWNEHFG